jgi:hypothetical protein
MAYVDWRMQDLQISNCNCDVGCLPVQLPAHPRELPGLLLLPDRSGPLRKGAARRAALGQPVRVARSDPSRRRHRDGGGRRARRCGQRAALEAIAQGRETEPGSLITPIFSTTIAKGLPTQFKPIELAIDERAGTARLRVPALIEGSAEPIKNPVTGEPHRVRVLLPTGFEYRDAEYVSGTGKATGPIALDFQGTHAHIAKADWSTRGVVS